MPSRSQYLSPVLLSAVICALLVGNAVPQRAAAATAETAPVVAPAAERTITLFQSNNRVMVMMRINDGPLLPMVFDTGSDGNSIDHRVVKSAKLKRVGKGIEIDGTTGKERTLPLVAMPNVTLAGMKFGTLDATELGYDPNDAMGIISSEIFTDSLVYVELARNRVRLVPRSSAELPPGPATPYHRDIATIDIGLPDGTTIPAHFDSGYNATLSLPIAMMDKVPLMAPPKVIGQFKSINTVGDVMGGQIKGKITIGSIALENPQVAFLGDLANIGLPIIRQVTLVLDPAQKRNWVLPVATK